MTKKDYQLFGDIISQITEEKEREKIIALIVRVFKYDNSRFNESKFREWIKRRRENKSLKGLRYNPNYLILPIK